MTHKMAGFGRILMILGLIFDLSNILLHFVRLRIIEPAEKGSYKSKRVIPRLGSKFPESRWHPLLPLPQNAVMLVQDAIRGPWTGYHDINNDWRDNLLGKYLSPTNTRQAVARYDGLTANINIPPDQPEKKKIWMEKISWLKLISEKYVRHKYKTTNLV